MPRTFLVTGVGFVVATMLQFPIYAQQPAAASDADRGLESVTIAIQGRYVKADPVPGRKESLHQVQAGDRIIDLDTRAYPGLEEWLDKGQLKSGVSRVSVSGDLTDIVEDQAKSGGHCHLVCKVVLFQLLDRPRSDDGTAAPRSEHRASGQPKMSHFEETGRGAPLPDGVEGATRAAMKGVGPVGGEAARKAEKLAEQINKAGGLTLLFNNRDDSSKAIVQAVKDAGLRMVGSDPSSGLIFAECVGDHQVDAALVRKLISNPAYRSVTPRRKPLAAPYAEAPPGERPSRIETRLPNSGVTTNRAPD